MQIINNEKGMLLRSQWKIMRNKKILVMQSLVAILGVVLATTPVKAKEISEETKQYEFWYTVTDGEAYVDGAYGSDAPTMVVPEQIDGYPVVGIGNPHFSNGEFEGLHVDDDDYVVDNYTIKKVVLPGTIRHVMNGFLGTYSAIEELVISDGANFTVSNEIYYEYQRKSIRKIYIGSNMADPSVPYLTYDLAALEEIEVSENNPVYKSQDGILFSKDMKKLLNFPMGKKVEKYIVPEGVTNIGIAFQGCQNIKTIQLSESVSDADDYAFKNCSAQIIYPPKTENESVKEKRVEIEETDNESVNGDVWNSPTGEWTYQVVDTNKKSRKVIIIRSNNLKKKCEVPDMVQINGLAYQVIGIGAKAFYNNKRLVSVVIPDTVTQIGNNAFAGCTKLKTVTIGKGIQIIEKNAFKNCKSLKSLTIKGTKLRTVGKSALKGVHAKCKIKVPAKKQIRYKKLLKGKGQKISVKVIK